MMRFFRPLLALFLVLVLMDQAWAQCPYTQINVPSKLIFFTNNIKNVTLKLPASIKPLSPSDAWTWQGDNPLNPLLSNSTSLQPDLQLGNFAEVPDVREFALSLSPRDPALLTFCRDVFPKQVLVRILPSLKVYDVVTNNGDDYNAFWEIEHLDGYQKPKIRLFDRWGTLVFESIKNTPRFVGRDMSNKDLPTGTYVYSIQADEDYPEVVGQLTIMR